jgi:CheY-like chemotaxis protein
MPPAYRVLIVDDEESVRTFAARVLDRAGYQTRVASDGPEALAIVEAGGPFDLLLADVVMPEMNGDELARRLLKREPDLKVLYFTGYSDQLFAERIPLGENEAFLDKPVSMKGLVEAVSLILAGHLGKSDSIQAGAVDPAEQRSPRVAAPALRVRLGDTEGRLVNISATGALVLLPHTMPSDREWPLQIEMAPPRPPVNLRVRVVRSYPASVSLPEAMWQHREYAVALAFRSGDPRVEEILKALSATPGG